MIFENTCNCLFDDNILEKSIIDECTRRNINPKEKYKIYNYRGYAGISLKHDTVSVHRIIGKYMVGFDFGSEIHVHHVDRNRFNNNIENLQVIKKELHSKEHYIVQYVDKEKLRQNAKIGTEKIKRKDITTEQVTELRKEGMKLKQIANVLGCGYNTVCRRLGMKDY